MMLARHSAETDLESCFSVLYPVNTVNNLCMTTPAALATLTCMKHTRSVDKLPPDNRRLALKKQLTADYQLAHEQFIIAREQVNEATRQMRAAEAKKAQIAHALVSIDQQNLALESPVEAGEAGA
jgi:hypothetical protein